MVVLVENISTERTNSGARPQAPLNFKDDTFTAKNRK